MFKHPDKSFLHCLLGKAFSLLGGLKRSNIRKEVWAIEFGKHPFLRFGTRDVDIGLMQVVLKADNNARRINVVEYGERV